MATNFGKLYNTNSKLAGVDSVYSDQRSMYANATKKYLHDYQRQYDNAGLDANTAYQGIAQNQQRGLTTLNEDFASRGLGNSGMLINEQDRATDAFSRQKSNITTGLKNTRDDLGFRKTKYLLENDEGGSNLQAARREAYARLAANQSIV